MTSIAIYDLIYFKNNHMTPEINSVFVKIYTTSSSFRLNGKESPGSFTLVTTWEFSEHHKKVELQQVNLIHASFSPKKKQGA